MIDGRTLVPNLDQSIGLALGLGKQLKQNRAGQLIDQAINAPDEEVMGLVSKIAQVGGTDMAQGVMQMIQSNDQRELAQAQQQARDMQAFAVKLRNIKDPRDRRIFISNEIRRRIGKGLPYDKLLEPAKMDFEQQNFWATQNMITADNVGKLVDRYLIPAQPEKPTSLMQNLEAAGLTPGTPEYQRAVKEAVMKPQQTTTITNVLGKERNEMAKVHGRRYEKLLEEGDVAEGMIQTLDQLDAIDVTTGALEPAKAAFGAIAEGFGFDASGFVDVDSAQSLEAVSNRLVNDVLNKAKGPQTEGDAIRAKKTIASLKDSPLAKQFKSDSMRAVALRTIELRDFINQRVDAGKTFSQARGEWNKFKNSTPSLSSLVKDRETGLPMFYFQFKQKAKQANPDASDEEIIQAWRNLNKK